MIEDFQKPKHESNQRTALWLWNVVVPSDTHPEGFVDQEDVDLIAEQLAKAEARGKQQAAACTCGPCETCEHQKSVAGFGACCGLVSATEWVSVPCRRLGNGCRAYQRREEGK